MKIIYHANVELHMLPYFDRYDLTDVIDAMDKTKIDVLALEALDNSIYSRVKDFAKMYLPCDCVDDAGIALRDGKFILNAREYNTLEGFRVLTIGCSLDNVNNETSVRKVIEMGLEKKALVVLDHPFVDNDLTHTAGHIPFDLEWELDNLCREFSSDIALEWNSYCVPWVRNVLKSVLNLACVGVRYYDVNKKADELANHYNLPLVANTDLHARKKKHLLAMGTARMIMNIKGFTATEAIGSIKKNIFSGDFVNVKGYVGLGHLLSAFCLPVLFPRFYYKPRA